MEPRHSIRIAVPLAVALASFGCSETSNLGVTRDGGGRDASRPSTPRADECGNGLDDDGNGRVDDGCPCGPGETQSCFGGPANNRGRGACRDGVQTCGTPAGTEWGDWGDYPCSGDTRPSAEMCDGMDRDCDGARDEDCPCTDGDSRACGVEFVVAPCTGGTQTCRAGRWTGCEGAVGPSPDICGDRVDNDCDGTTDDLCDCVPEPEICRDGRDNDCDGEIDEPACMPDWPPSDGGVTRPDAGPYDAGPCDPSLVAPRQIAPLSTSRVTTLRPELRWVRSAGSTQTRVELCGDPGCADVREVILAASDTARPTAPLPYGPTFWRARAVGASDVVGCEPSATWEMFVGHRDAPVDTVSGIVMDTNRDGWPDFVVSDGSLGGDANSFAMLYAGQSGGLPSAPAFTWSTPRPSPVLGARLDPMMAAGDLDGDGFGEVVLCQPYLEQCWVYLGGATATSVVSAVIPGVWAFGAGDTDGDGYGDLVVRTRSSGTAIWYGSATPFTGTTVVVDATQYYAYPVGDTNGDRLGDVLTIVDTPTDAIAGRTRVYLGRASRTYGAPDIAFELAKPVVSTNPAHYGNNFAAADVNGDGYTDLLIGESDSVVFPEQTRVHLGGPAGPAAAPAVSLLARVNPARVGDVNGDGYEDIVAHSSGADVVLLLGGPGGLTEAGTVISYTSGSDLCRIAWSVGAHIGVGDLDRDGYEDYARAYGEECGAVRSTVAAIHLGSAAGLSPMYATRIPVPAGVPLATAPHGLAGLSGHHPH